MQWGERRERGQIRLSRVGGESIRRERRKKWMAGSCGGGCAQGLHALLIMALRLTQKRAGLGLGWPDAAAQHYGGAGWLQWGWMVTARHSRQQRHTSKPYAATPGLGAQNLSACLPCLPAAADAAEGQLGDGGKAGPLVAEGLGADCSSWSIPAVPAAAATAAVPAAACAADEAQPAADEDARSEAASLHALGQYRQPLTARPPLTSRLPRLPPLHLDAADAASARSHASTGRRTPSASPAAAPPRSPDSEAGSARSHASAAGVLRPRWNSSTSLSSRLPRPPPVQVDLLSQPSALSPGVSRRFSGSSACSSPQQSLSGSGGSRLRSPSLGSSYTRSPSVAASSSMCWTEGGRSSASRIPKPQQRGYNTSARRSAITSPWATSAPVSPWGPRRAGPSCTPPPYSPNSTQQLQQLPRSESRLKQMAQRALLSESPRNALVSHHQRSPSGASLNGTTRIPSPLGKQARRASAAGGWHDAGLGEEAYAQLLQSPFDAGEAGGAPILGIGRVVPAEGVQWLLGCAVGGRGAQGCSACRLPVWRVFRGERGGGGGLVQQSRCCMPC